MEEYMEREQGIESRGVADWAYRLLPLSGIIFPALTLTGSDADPWVRGAASSFAFLLLATWVYRELWPAVAEARRTRRNRKVGEEIARKVKERLGVLEKYLSTNYGHSPCAVGHRVSTDAPNMARINYAHVRAIEYWRKQWEERIFSQKDVLTTDVQSISVLVNECNFLAEECERVVRDYVGSPEIDGARKTGVVADWNAAKDVFNGELQEWSRIFQGVNFDREGRCFSEHRPLKQIP